MKRLWPRSMVSWNRVLAGRFRDPLVGRDLLVGFTANAAALLFYGLWWGGILRGPLPPFPNTDPLLALQGGRFILGQLFQAGLIAVAVPLGFVALFLLLRIITRRTWIAAVLLSLIFGVTGTLQFTALSGGQPSGLLVLIGLLFGALQIAIVLVLFIRFGLLATLAFFVFGGIASNYGMPLDPSAPYFGAVLFGWLLLLAMVAYAFWVALAGQRVFQDVIMEAPASQT